MNKIASLLTLVILTSQASFAKNYNIESTLRIKTQLGYSKKHLVQVKGRKVRANGTVLSKADVLTHYRHLQNTLHTQKKTVIFQCPAGTFVHQVKRGSKIERESGCLRSQRFQELDRSYRVLANEN